MNHFQPTKIALGWLMILVLTGVASCSRTYTLSPAPAQMTNTPTPSGPTNTPTNTPSNTWTNTPTKTFTPTFTSTPTGTFTSTPTNTPLFTFTSTSTYTVTNTPTFTNTPTNTLTNTPTSTFTITNTPTNTPTPTVNVFTLGGTLSTFGYADGNPGSFWNPIAVAVDSSGNIYVADQHYGLIRKITPGGAVTNGSVTTLAGGGGTTPPTRGYIDATGTAAEFFNPSGLAVDSSGNIYVADTSNNVIRKITSAGVVSTLAGQLSGASGNANGTGTAASFTAPSGVALNSAGTTLYVADTGNQLIRAITLPGAAVTTLAGSGSIGSNNGTGTSASFANPNGVAVDSSGNVDVADTGNNMIRAITPGGVVSTLAGQTTPGWNDATGTAAQFSQPYSVSVDLLTGNVYVADRSNQVIRKITPGGVVSTIAGTVGTTGSPGNGPGPTAKFNFPSGVAVYSGTSPIIIYVADENNELIRSIQ